MNLVQKQIMGEYIVLTSNEGTVVIPREEAALWVNHEGVWEARDKGTFTITWFVQPTKYSSPELVIHKLQASPEGLTFWNAHNQSVSMTWSTFKDILNASEKGSHLISKFHHPCPTCTSTKNQ